MAKDTLLRETRLLDYSARPIQALIDQRGWRGLPTHDRIGAAYTFVRDEIAFAYNARDDLPASRVLAQGYGQCNTKAVLLMAMLRGLGISCRLHAATVWKSLKRGVIPPLIYALGPDEILHTWVEVPSDDGWAGLEGVILDAAYLDGLRRALRSDGPICAYGVGTESLAAPQIDWTGTGTTIQSTAVNRDLGIWDTPDALFAKHAQKMGPLRGALYAHLVRHRINARVAAIRAGRAPALPGGVPTAPSETKGTDCARTAT